MSILTIGTWLQSSMRQRKLTTVSVAQHLGVRPNTISAWRSGQNDVSRHVINELCDWWELDDAERLRALSLPVTVDEDIEPEAVAA